MAAAFYWWFSVVNLFMISVFWSLIVDIFTPTQAARLLPTIAGGGSLGAIAGPRWLRFADKAIGVSGLLLMAAAGLFLVIVLVHGLMREKHRLQAVMKRLRSRRWITNCRAPCSRDSARCSPLLIL